MSYLFETLVVSVFSLAALFLAFLILLNLYLIKRNGFRLSINCWFCNNWTKVAYQDRNSFECPNCLQYNGFREDGSYNKVIKAQHDTLFTKYTTQKTESYKNGLCTYCNNNQQLKIFQLAKFTPLREENYDEEVEHFRNQLEKVYKLCKKCEKVLKFTIDRQHSWLFGNRLKYLRNKGAAVLNLTILKEDKNRTRYFLRFIRLILIILTILVLCYILNIRIVYPNINLNKYLPTEVFTPYKLILLDFYKLILNNFKQFKKDIDSLSIYIPGGVNIHLNDLTPVTLLGLLLDMVFSFGKKRTFLWKVNGPLAWILLGISSLSFADHFTVYIFSIKILASMTLLCHYIWFLPIEITKNEKEYQFKKLSKSNDNVESSEEDTDEEIPYPLKPQEISRFSSTCHRAYSSLNGDANLNSFTAKNVTSTSDLYNFSNSSGSDLNRSLDNLHLTNLSPKSQRCTSPIYSVSSVKRPILSPAKLKNVTQNPWTAGGFWKNDASLFSASVDPRNLSRSSSQSSGFVSSNGYVNNNPFSSLPASRESSLNGEVDRVSILSEPAYHFSPINHTKNSTLYYKGNNNTFYPVLNQNSMLFIHNGIPQQNFGNSSLMNFDTRAKSIVSPSLFSEKPISPLFKNLNLAGNVQKPQFS